MTGFTADGLPYPNDYTKPADSPSAFQDLADATQRALDTKPDTTDTEALYVKSPSGVLITDWNAINVAGFYRSDVGASNSPDPADKWNGIVRYWSGVGYHQMINSATGHYPYGAILQRSYLPGIGWTPWARVVNYAYSWALLDNFIFHRHGTDGPGVDRFAAGMAKDPATAAASALDEWRVQCYDTAGNFTWSAIKIPESGVVTMPKGHATALTRIRSGEPIPADTVLTVGMLAEILRAGVGPGELNVGPPSEEVT
jgi:hypothetical protein